MTKKYKDASKVVDAIRGGRDIPTFGQIASYKDFQATIDKARWMRRYLEAIRTERTGRQLQTKRFFLKGSKA
jgi:hypothetical protein